MTKAELYALEEKAKAIPGNLTIYSDKSIDTGCWVGVPSEGDAKFIAESPAIILNLIYELLQLENCNYTVAG